MGLVRAATATATTAFLLLAVGAVLIDIALFLVEGLFVRTIAESLFGFAQSATANVYDVATGCLDFGWAMGAVYHVSCHRVAFRK